MASDLAANMRATTEALVMSFDGPTWSVERSLAPRAPECIHQILPRSPTRPARTNDEWRAYFKRLQGMVTDAKMTIDDYLAVPEERKSVCRTSLDATTPVGPYSNDYVWFLTFNDSGDKIIRITEFIGSKEAGKLVAELKEAGYLKDH